MTHLELLLLLLLSSCLDFTNPDDVNSPPLIDKTHVTPLGNAMLQPINIGLYCQAREFMIPPIHDINLSDDLYYLWFIKRPSDVYGVLLQPKPGLIASNIREKSVTSILLERHMIETAFGGKLPDDFFSGTYIVQFFVADRPYLIPQSRYLEAGGFEDSFYWLATFINQKC